MLLLNYLLGIFYYLSYFTEIIGNRTAETIFICYKCAEYGSVVENWPDVLTVCHL